MSTTSQGVDNSSTASFTFSGQFRTLHYLQRTNEILPGTSIAIYGSVEPITDITPPFSQWSFSLDGGATDTFTPSNTQTGRQVLLHRYSSLSDGSHSITISRTGGTLPRLWLDYLEYNISPKTDLQGSTLFFDDVDARIDYTGNWSAVPPSSMTGYVAAFGNTATKVGTSGGSFTFTFDGVFVILLAKSSGISSFPQEPPSRYMAACPLPTRPPPAIPHQRP
jgi:hypothetical protein